jgi:hypothetical protein
MRLQQGPCRLHQCLQLHQIQGLQRVEFQSQLLGKTQMDIAHAQARLIEPEATTNLKTTQYGRLTA